MGVIKSIKLPDGYTPICNECGVHLCWDISRTEYEERPKFWEDWICKDCSLTFADRKNKKINS